VAGKNLFDDERVRALPDGGELVLGPGDLATPAALDRAFAKGIAVRWSGARRAAGTPGAASGAVGERGGLMARMLAADGTYVVTVRAGRAVVHRLTEAGPQPLTEG
jgi:hypothetical protein